MYMSSMTVQSLNTATTALLIRPEPLATRAAHWPLLGGPSRPWPPADSSSSSRMSQKETPLVHTYISCMSVQTLSMHILPLIFSYVGQVKNFQVSGTLVWRSSGRTLPYLGSASTPWPWSPPGTASIAQKAPLDASGPKRHGGSLDGNSSFMTVQSI